jgi:histone H3/H4
MIEYILIIDINKVLREIRKLHRITNFLILKVSFQQMIKKIMKNMNTFDDSSCHDFQIQKDALNVIQEFAESFIVENFKSTIILMFINVIFMITY